MEMQHGFLMNNGRFIPAIGLGTYLAEPNKVGEAVKCALEQGYTHIDCARIYANEKEIGTQAIGPYLKTNKREQLFITSKLWIDQLERVKESCQESINDLQCNYLDLYLIHWPVAQKEGMLTEFQVEKVWGEMEKLVQNGLVKSIGISNFTPSQIERVLKCCTIKPVINQVELNAYFQQTKLRELCSNNEILIECYRPIGGAFVKGSKHVLEDSVIVQLAQKYQKSPAQICLKWVLQHGMVALPKSTTPERIFSNIQLFDWKLNDEDMKLIDTIDLNKRDVVCDGFFNGKTRQQFWEEY